MRYIILFLLLTSCYVPTENFVVNEELFLGDGFVLVNGERLSLDIRAFSYDSRGFLARHNNQLWLYDFDLNPVRKISDNVHHDASFGENSIFHLEVEQIENEGTLYYDIIVESDFYGNEISRWRFFDNKDMFNFDEPYGVCSNRRECEYMHVNSLEYIKSGPYKGGLLISDSKNDYVFILKNDKIVWEIKGITDGQHSPTITDRGILIFDNRELQSRVIEIDYDKNILWQVEGFFSNIQGHVQRLKNGNTLITESTTGKAFEVSPSNEIIWEYQEEKSDNSLGRIYRLIKVE